MRYIISDTHFYHDNIRKYCNRNFDNREEMDEAMIENWNSVVDKKDSVIHLGDVTHYPSPLSTADWLEKLNGNILLIRGNHDEDVSQNPRGFNVVESCTIRHGRFTFYLEHGPVENSNYWQIFGHIHNNNMRDYPFINYEKKKINVSVELIDYTPLRMGELMRILDERQRFSTLQEARDKIDYDAEIFQ